MSVVGFDIGNENCVIATVKQRGIDVLLNDESNRETPAVICFGEKQRFLGAAGAASATMNTKSTISQVKRLIGRNFADPDVQNELKMLPFETSGGKEGGILIHFKYLGEKQTFTPVQIMAMLFSHLKEITEKNLEMPVRDCVIGIPSYFSDLQRRAYLNAAAIAGLKPLRLMHDSTATALGYGIYKTDLSNSGPTYVTFVDIGHCDMQVSVVSFEAGHMRVLSHAFDSSLGGRDFDEVLFSYFAEQFKEQYKIDVYTNVRACVRLRTACEKLKKVLSANAEAPLNIECLMDEKDVKGFIKREEFEKLASGLLERITVPCRKALADSGISVGKIHAIELVGSGSRIPAIMKQLASLFGKEPCRTLNASECVARGCALQCAMLSPIFRVREYEVQDSFPFSIGFSSDEGPVGTGLNGILFPKAQSIPSIKNLTFQRSNLLRLEAFYANVNELPPGVSAKISSFTIGPFPGSHSENARVKVNVQLNLHGIVTVESAMLMEKHIDDPVRRANAPSEMDKMEVDSGSGDENDVTVDLRSSDASANGAIRDKGSRRLEIPVREFFYGGMTEIELSEAKEKELQLAEQDKIVEQAKERKNALESYVYDMRNKLFNTYRSFANDEEREGISRSFQETEEWLYEDGDDETEDAYSSKLQDLNKLVDPIENRYKDEEARAQAIQDLLNCIVDYRKAVNSLPVEDSESINNECSKAEQWLRERTQLQDTLPKNIDPVLWSKEIKSRTEDLNSVCKHILEKKDPPENVEDAEDEP
ncbi:heat shock 70 kDa protein 16 [Mercurialis annua]|uniref:heat shock 70 kDa protein 16 n=1 Tax=Mercurialis annua TaxID=3986 RepID=UPI002160CB2B|nr:heat shock 70 kDa protein 16 [Mercurialis annua]